MRQHAPKAAPNLAFPSIKYIPVNAHAHDLSPFESLIVAPNIQPSSHRSVLPFSPQGIFPPRTMGLHSPPSYEYEPVPPILTPSESTAGNSDLNIDPDVRDRGFELARFKIEKLEERKRMALRQAYIWAMTATIGGVIMGCLYIIGKFNL